MHRVYALLVFLLLSVAGAGLVAASPPAQGTPPPGTPWVNVCDGAGNCTPYVPYVAVDTATPTNTPSPTPSATPSSTPVIVIPTSTPSHTPEPPTPTPETGTPVPTEPTTKWCMMRGIIAINERNIPSTSGSSVVGSWQPGQERTITEFVSSDGYLWAHHEHGWSVVRETSWWVAGSPGVDLCRDIPGWPEGIDPPPAFARGPEGVHTIRLGWGADMVAPYFNDLDTLKCFIADEHGYELCRTARVINPDIVIVVRSGVVGGTLRDCPDDYYMEHPAEWVQNINYLPPASEGVILEINNECWPNGADWDAVNAFVLGATKAANAMGYPVLAWSFFPAHPELEAWAHFCPWFEYSLTARVNGQPNGVAFHLSGWYPGDPTKEMLWVNNPWVANYHHLADAALREACGFGLRGLPVYSTELAWTDGYTKLAPNVQAVAYTYTAQVVAGDPLISGFHAWNQGLCSSWACLHEAFPLIWP